MLRVRGKQWVIFWWCSLSCGWPGGHMILKPLESPELVTVRSFSVGKSAAQAVIMRFFKL